MSEEPTDTPSAPLIDPSTSDDLESNDPFAAEPPLTIAHLMLCGLCVAVYLSAVQTAMQAYKLPIPLSGIQITLWAMNGMIQGTGLAGILLLATRRLRRIPFPQYNGEMLWIIIGTQAAMNLAGHFRGILNHNIWFLRYLSFLFDNILVTYTFGLLILAAWAAIYLYAILHAKTRRWRNVFAIMVATGIAVPLLTGMLARGAGLSKMITITSAINFSHQLIIVNSILIASWIDFRQSQHYPWTHWTGIIFYLLQFAGTTLGLVAVLLIGQ